MSGTWNLTLLTLCVYIYIYVYRERERERERECGLHEAGRPLILLRDGTESEARDGLLDGIRFARVFHV